MRVVRFYLSCLVLLLLPPPPASSSSSPPPLVVLLVLLVNCDSRSTVFAVGPQPRPSTPSVPCRTSTTTIHAQCSLPDLNHDHPRPVFPAGPQPRVSTPKDMPHRVPEDMPDRMLEDMLDRMPDGMPEDLPDNMPEDMPDRMPDGMPEDMPEHMPEDMPEDMPEHLPEDMPEHLPEDMPGRMPEDMPDRMPENMSDRMPEDLPVTKCINVMVGITRSKVIICGRWLNQKTGANLVKMGITKKTHLSRDQLGLLDENEKLVSSPCHLSWVASWVANQQSGMIMVDLLWKIYLPWIPMIIYFWQWSWQWTVGHCRP